MAESYLEKIQKEFPELKVISIIYKNDEEIYPEDKQLFYEFLMKIREDKAIVILHNNSGGDFFAAFNLSLILHEKFKKKLYFMIPEKVSSATTLPLFLGRKLFMLKGSFITPCDCYFSSREVPPYIFRACKELKHENSEIRKNSKILYDNSIKILKTFFQTKNSLIYDKLPLAFKQKETFILKIIDELERKDHIQNITANKLTILGFNVEEIEFALPMYNLTKNYLKDTQNRLREQNKRFSIETTDVASQYD